MVGVHESNSFRLSLVKDVTQGPVGAPLAGVPPVAADDSGEQNDNDGHHRCHCPHGFGGDSQCCRRSVQVEAFILKKMNRVNPLYNIILSPFSPPPKMALVKACIYFVLKNYSGRDEKKIDIGCFE